GPREGDRGGDADARREEDDRLAAAQVHAEAPLRAGDPEPGVVPRPPLEEPGREQAARLELDGDLVDRVPGRGAEGVRTGYPRAVDERGDDHVLPRVSALAGVGGIGGEAEGPHRREELPHLD